MEGDAANCNINKGPVFFTKLFFRNNINHETTSRFLEQIFNRKRIICRSYGIDNAFCIDSLLALSGS